MQFRLPAPATLSREMRATLQLGLPLIAGQLLAISMNVIDVLLAGHLGARVLGAVAVGTSIWTIALVAALGTMMSLAPSVAQLDGAGQRDRAAPLFCQALWIAAAQGILLQQAMWWLGPLLARVTDIDAILLPDVEAFLRAISFGAPAIGLLFACRGLSEGLSMTRPTLMFSVIGPALLAPVGYVLMYGARGVPGLGALGSGIATSVVTWADALAFFAFVLLSPRYRGLGWDARRLWPDPRAILGLLHIGGPMAVALLLETGLFSAASLVVGGFGADVVAGHQVALNAAVVAFMVPMGFALATTVRVGNTAGRADRAGARRAGFTGLLLAAMGQSVSCALMLLMPRRIAEIFTDDPAVIDVATTLLRLAGIFQFADGIQVAANGALRGLKDTRMPMVIVAFAYWGVGMPVGWYLAYHAGFGARGMWIGLIAGLFCAALLLTARFEARTRHSAATR